MWNLRKSLFAIALFPLLPSIAQSAHVDQRPIHIPSSAPLLTIKNETQALLDLHRQLVQIKSTSGEEYDIGIFLEDFLLSYGFTIFRQLVPDLPENPSGVPRYNVYAYYGGSSSCKIVLSSHIDTVPPYYNYTLVDKPSTLQSTSNGPFIKGRGAVDAKASVAAQIIAALSLISTGKVSPGDLSLLFVVGEEVSGDGMREFNSYGVSWKAGIFGEPTWLKLVSGHKGILGLTLRARGKSAHSGYPWLGEDANAKLISAMARLQEADLGSSEKYGNTTVNIGRIRAGAAGNVVSDYGEAIVQIRIADGTAEELKEKVMKVIGDEVEVDFRQGYGPVDLDADVDGFETTTVNYWTDVPRLDRDKVGKRYLYGPGDIFVAHSDHEVLDFQDMLEAVQGYKKLALHALNA